ncbi:hypothetical protein Tco_1292366 [Tanacetum coccineum]
MQVQKREEAQAVRSSLAQVRAMVTEMEAANDLDEYYDSLRCLRESWRIGEDKLRDKLSDVAESPRLADKIKYVFGRSRDEDESFAKLMRDLCFHMKEIVARDAVTLGELETLLARAQVGVSLKLVLWLIWKKGSRRS